MKVIAKANESRYICEVSHEELEKFFDQYYGKMRKLEVGHELDLSQGYDFAVRIEAACKSMTETMTQFDRARKTMTDFALVVAQQSKGGTTA